MSDVDEKVKEMAKLVVVSNKISEFHEKNLKMFPFVFFEGVKGVFIDYDLGRLDSVELDGLNNITVGKPRNKNYVRYSLTMDEKAENTYLERRFAAIESSVRNIFWKNLTVEIKFNDTTVFKSK